MRAAVDSIINQTFTDWELIIIDDGSAEELSLLFPSTQKIKVFRQTNQGISTARNIGVMKTKAQLVTFLDSDDVWRPTYLEHQVEVMNRQPETALCYPVFDLIDGTGQTIGPTRARQPSSYLELLEGPCPHFVMLRRTVLAHGGFYDRMLKSCEDYDVYLKVALSQQISTISTCEASYRRHDQNATLDYHAILTSVDDIQQRHKLLAKTKGTEAFTAVSKACEIGRRRYRHDCGIVAYHAARKAFRQNDSRLMLWHLWNALCLNPHYTRQEIGTWFKARCPSSNSKATREQTLE